MTRQANTPHAFDSPHIPVQIKLAAAWTSFMFLYIYVDYLLLYKPDVIDGLRAGMVWRIEINELFLVGVIISMAIPILMILLSLVLPARVNRITNLVVAALYIPYSMMNALDETWIYFYGLSIGIEVLLLAFILRSAWMWPRTSSSSLADPVGAADQLSRRAHV